MDRPEWGAIGRKGLYVGSVFCCTTLFLFSLLLIYAAFSQEIWALNRQYPDFTQLQAFSTIILLMQCLDKIRELTVYTQQLIKHILE